MNSAANKANADSKRTKFSSLILENQTTSDDESFFCAQFMEQRKAAVIDFTFKLGIAYNTVTIAAVLLIGEPNIKVALAGAHAVIATLTLLSSLKILFSRQASSRILALLLAAPSIAYAGTIQYFITQKNAEHLLLSSTTFLLTSIFALLLVQGKRILHLALGIFLSSAAFWSYAEYSNRIVWPAIAALTFASVIAYRWYLDSRQLELAKREYKLLIQAAPAKIVRMSASNNQSLSDAFSPKHRHCVCISSDWRGYQKLSETVSPETLAEALGAYYELCSKLVAAAFPEGNYFTDWIADELFVVVYAHSKEEEVALVNRTLELCWSIIEKKVDFTKQHSFPHAIDIGISSGKAMIGMMGPSEHKKATALGDIPGRSRRYQAAGKLLRANLGEKDRVVFGPESLMEISVPLDIQEHKLGEDVKLRDLELSSLFFMEPEAKSDEPQSLNVA